MAETVFTANEANFDENVLQENFVLVDFWAPWCNPCKVLAPIFEEVAQSFQGKVRFAKVNVDENPNIAAKYSVRGIPFLILFKDGQSIATKVGSMTKSELIEFLKKNTELDV